MRPVFFYKSLQPQQRPPQQAGVGGSRSGLRQPSPWQSSASSPPAPSPRRTPAVFCGPSSSDGLAISTTAPGTSTTTICARPATLSATAWWPSPFSARGCTRSTCRGPRRFAGGVAARAGPAVRMASPVHAACHRLDRHRCQLRRVPPVRSSPAALARPTMSCSTPPAPARSVSWSGSCAGADGNPARNSSPLELRFQHHRIEAVPLRKAEPLVEPHRLHDCLRSR